MCRRSPGSRGFTLIEMLMVLSLLGLFISLVSHQNAKMIDRSRDVALMKEIGHIRDAVHQYLLDHQNLFPPDLASLRQYLNREFRDWRGSKGAGQFHYDRDRGEVVLYDEQGAGPSTVPDSRGVPYGRY